MNWIDILILLPLLVGLVRGLMRGFISEVIAVAVVILGALGARFLAPLLSGAILTLFAWPQGVCEVVAYVVIFLVIAILLSIIGKMLTKLIRAIHLGLANRILGGAFGIIKYGVFVLIAVFILNKTNEEYHYLDESPVVKSSVLYPKMVHIADAVLSFTRSELGQSGTND